MIINVVLAAVNKALSVLLVYKENKVFKEFQALKALWAQQAHKDLEDCKEKQEFASLKIALEKIALAANLISISGHNHLRF
jgi:hypothetical protein